MVILSNFPVMVLWYGNLQILFYSWHETPRLCVLFLDYHRNQQSIIHALDSPTLLRSHLLFHCRLTALFDEKFFHMSNPFNISQHEGQSIGSVQCSIRFSFCQNFAFWWENLHVTTIQCNTLNSNTFSLL